MLNTKKMVFQKICQELNLSSFQINNSAVKKTLRSHVNAKVFFILLDNLNVCKYIKQPRDFFCLI